MMASEVDDSFNDHRKEYDDDEHSDEADADCEGDAEDEEEWAAWEEGQKGRPERWAPLGANDTDKDSSNNGSSEEK